MKRNGHVVVVAHCLLNVNTKVHGIAKYPAVHPEVARLVADGVAIVQLPCPEATYLGMKRWGMTREQYDTAAYRRHARTILGPVVDTLDELARDGCEVFEVIGADGSPSCGVDRTCFGWSGGELEQGVEVPEARSVAGRGVFIDEFRCLLAERGLEPTFRGVDE